MSAPRLLLRAFVTVTVLAIATAGSAQDTKPLVQPEVGQAGKDVVWVPTPDALVEKMLDLAKVTAADYVIDLGSGDGRTVIAAAKRGARALGIEYNQELVDLSTEAAKAAGVADRATFAKADLFESDFSKATVITMFLLTDINLKLRPTLLDLKPGTRIVSNTFRMGSWEPDETATVEGDCPSWCTALLWIIPAKVDGAWKLGDEVLKLFQDFQTVSGTLARGQAANPLAGVRLRGDEIRFKAGQSVYTGRVTGDTMAGTVQTGQRTAKWTAKKLPPA